MVTNKLFLKMKGIKIYDKLARLGRYSNSFKQE